MTIEQGTGIGPYEIVAHLGSGGMGEVWRARDTRLERDVAIKVLPSGLAANEQFLQRFEREAKGDFPAEPRARLHAVRRG